MSGICERGCRRVCASPWIQRFRSRHVRARAICSFSPPRAGPSRVVQRGRIYIYASSMASGTGVASRPCHRVKFARGSDPLQWTGTTLFAPRGLCRLLAHFSPDDARTLRNSRKSRSRLTNSGCADLCGSRTGDDRGYSTLVAVISAQCASCDPSGGLVLPHSLRETADPRTQDDLHHRTE